jgi:hypothetical protein
MPKDNRKAALDAVVNAGVPTPADGGDKGSMIVDAARKVEAYLDEDRDSVR